MKEKDEEATLLTVKSITPYHIIGGNCIEPDRRITLE